VNGKPRLLDLFCGAGGAAKGYADAGFEVVLGIDKHPQPNYPYPFVQADALEWMRVWLDTLAEDRPLGVDAIHASPPCQAFTRARVIHGREHEDLLTPTRPLLQRSGLPWVIENVPGAPLRGDFVLCGSQFGEPRLKRHRLCEVNWEPAHLLPPCSHGRQIVSVFGHGGHIYHGVAEWREVMGIPWMLRDELAQAIPPTFTRFLGTQLLEHLNRTSLTKNSR
jgi:DNA (cytosine-5)-methyltransferase 1